MFTLIEIEDVYTKVLTYYHTSL